MPWAVPTTAAGSGDSAGKRPGHRLKQRTDHAGTEMRSDRVSAHRPIEVVALPVVA